MTRDDIMEKVVEVLEDALGADPEDIVPAASLTADLDAESIDFLGHRVQARADLWLQSRPR